MLLNLFRKSFNSSWNGKIGILYPVILRVMAGILRLGMLFAVCALIVAVSNYSMESGELVTWAVVLGMPLLLWWLLSASCRLMVWHELEKGSDESSNSREWLTDLPPMLFLDFFFALVKSMCFAAVILGVIAMWAKNPMAILTVSIGAMMALLCTVFQPMVIAERVVSGASLIQSVKNAISDLRRWPATALAVRFLPEFASTGLYFSAFALGMLGSSLFLFTLAIAGWLVSMIKPVFWTELVHLASHRDPQSEIIA